MRESRSETRNENADNADILARSASDDEQSVLARIERSVNDTRRAVSQSLRQLEAVDDGRHTIGTSGNWGTAARAVLLVLANAQLAEKVHGSQLDGDEIGDVARVCRTLGVGSRSLVLPDGWWREDQGPLVGLLRAEEAGQAGEVVALVPRMGGYLLLDPRTNMRQRVTSEIAARIAPMAFAIYPPLPEKVKGLVELGKFLWPALRPDLWRVFIASAVIGLVGLLLPIATGQIIDQLIPSGELSLLYQVGAALVAASALSAAFSAFQKLALLRLGGRAALILRAAVWNRVLRLPAPFFKNYSSGDLGQRIAGIDAMSQVMMSIILSTAMTAFFSCLYLALLFYYDTRFALVALGIVVALAIITFVTGLLQIKYHKRQAILSGWLAGYVFQVLQGIVKLRVAGAEDRAFARWAARYADERAAILATRRISNHFAAFAEAYGIISLAAIYAAVGSLGSAGLSAGTFIAFLAAFGAFQTAFLGLAGAALEIVAVMPDYERARPVLEAEPELTNAAADPGVLSGAIEISKLSFAYSPGGVTVLKDVSLAIAAGSHVAIVGPSGSGKSTLFRLLLGLERPLSGTVLYDGQDLSGLNLAALRRQIGVVLQTGRVFSGTILENIRGASNASMEECLDACAAAGFAGDLAGFPMGLHTPLTEGAATISGGQRQRLLIARALVTKPKILFMDEATSALDNRTQAVVTDSLDRLDVTRLVIAHRLSTVRQADTIIVMDKGAIAESGSYDELIAADGMFAQLASRQLT